MIVSLGVEKFLAARKAGFTILDVRSNSEFDQAHIPGAVSMPMFEDEDRAAVGTTYKQRGRAQAINLGLKLVQPRLGFYRQQARRYQADGQVMLHCWRGGMRSALMASFLEKEGYRVITLKGGYKSFRRAVLETIQKIRLKLLVIGGYTGSGKTDILHQLAHQGYQVIDLEGLAGHMGSAFGNLGRKKQTSQEQFENKLGLQLMNIKEDKLVFIEDESRLLGRLSIPPETWQQMRQARAFKISLPRSERVKWLLKDYGDISISLLKSAIEKIRKRLGGLRTTKALEALEQGRFDLVASIVLEYYDRAYEYGLQKRDPALVTEYKVDQFDLENLCQQVLNFARPIE